jgi:hypothetical protein
LAWSRSASPRLVLHRFVQYRVRLIRFPSLPAHFLRLVSFHFISRCRVLFYILSSLFLCFIVLEWAIQKHQDIDTYGDCRACMSRSIWGAQVRIDFSWFWIQIDWTEIMKTRDDGFPFLQRRIMSRGEAVNSWITEAWLSESLNRPRNANCSKCAMFETLLIYLLQPWLAFECQLDNHGIGETQVSKNENWFWNADWPRWTLGGIWLPDLSQLWPTFKCQVCPHFWSVFANIAKQHWIIESDNRPWNNDRESFSSKSTRITPQKVSFTGEYNFAITTSWQIPIFIKFTEPPQVNHSSRKRRGEPGLIWTSGFWWHGWFGQSDVKVAGFRRQANRFVKHETAEVQITI